MKRIFPQSVLCAVLLPLAAPVHAASSQVTETAGAALRVVTAGPADADGNVRAMLEIGLKDGWKTYWLDPGAAGVPPVLTIGSSPPLELSAPAPDRVDDGVTIWAGYKHSMALTFSLPAGSGPQIVDVFLGVCEKICVPVQAALTIDPSADPDNPADVAALAEAEAALPAPVRPDFHVTGTRIDGDRLHVTAILPAGIADAELFLAGHDGWAFGAPRREAAPTGTIAFSLWHDRPKAAYAPASFLYVLKADGQAVSGRAEIK